MSYYSATTISCTTGDDTVPVISSVVTWVRENPPVWTEGKFQMYLRWRRWNSHRRLIQRRETRAREARLRRNG